MESMLRSNKNSIRNLGFSWAGLDYLGLCLGLILDWIRIFRLGFSHGQQYARNIFFKES